jgi:Ca2+-binding EF-hand superfamily protein
MQAGLMIGVMDDDMDAKLQPAELKGNMGETLKKYFAMIDTNKDGGVDRKELEAAQKLMPKRRPATAAAEVTPAGGVPGGR